MVPCVYASRRALVVHCVVQRLGYTANIFKLILTFTGEIPHCVSRARDYAFTHDFANPRTMFMGKYDNLQKRYSSGSGVMRYVKKCPPNASNPYSIEYSSKAKADEPWQWCGWRVHAPPSWWVRMSCWIKFIDKVPAPSYNFGLKLHGYVCNDWVSECKADQWHFVSATGRCTGGDGSHVILIFDSIAHPVTVRFTDLHYELFAK